MAESIDIDKLQIEISASSEDASKKIRALANAMGRLKKAIGENENLNSIAKALKDMTSSVGDTANIATAAKEIKNIGKQEGKIGNVADYLIGISKIDFSNLTSASNVIGELAEIAQSSKRGLPQGKKNTTGAEQPTPQGAGEESGQSVTAQISLWERIKRAIWGATTNAKEFTGAISSAEDALSATKNQLLGIKLEGLKGKLKEALESGESQEKIAAIALQIKNLQSQIETTTSGIEKLAKNIALIPFNRLKNTVTDAVKSINKFTSSVGRILMYRAIRTVLKEITQGIKEGIDNLSAYSRLIGTDFHKSLDGIASDALYIKNSFATVAAPIINFVKPAFDALADSIANALNLLAQFMARITGASSYTMAVKSVTKYGDAVAAANNKVKQFTISIDELNVISDSSGGSGKEMPDFKSMFDEVAIENINPEIMDFADKIKKAIEKGDWRGVGRLFAEKLNGIIDQWDAYGWGKKFGEKFNDALNLAYGFLSTFNFRGLGSKIAEFINGALETINFELWGRTVTRKFTSMLDFLIGFLGTLNWGLIARKISDFIVGAINEFSDWVATINWKNLGTSIYTSLKEFFTDGESSGINYDEIVASVFRALGSAFGAAVGTIDGFFAGVWDDLKAYFETKLSEAGESIPKALFQGILDGLNLIGKIEDWIDNHIAKPFLDGVKGALGIDGEESSIMKMYGNSVSTGFTNGILSALPWYGAVKRAQWVIDNIVNPIIDTLTGQDGFDIHSPSKKTSDIGEMVAEGLLQGLLKRLGAPAAWIKENVGDPIVDGFKSFFGIDGGGSSVFEELGANLVAGLVAGLANVGSKIGEFGNNILTSVKNVLGIHSPSTEFEEIGEYSVEGLSKGFSKVTTITSLFQTEMENCKTAAKDFSVATEAEIARLAQTVNSLIEDTYKMYKERLNSALAYTKNVMSNMTDAYNSMSNSSVSAIGRIISALNSIPTHITTTHTIITEHVGGSNLAVPAYASGGFPEDGLFFANHNELVGTFSNGKTAVANNEEIVAGIANGVASANAEQNALLREQNELLSAILSKTGVSLDGKTLMTSVERAQRQRGANIMAGGVRV